MADNIFRTHDGATTVTDIDQPDTVDIERVRRRGSTMAGGMPIGVLNRKTPPRVGDLGQITRKDVELFFEAAHAFRTRLATSLPDIANKVAEHILGTPYTMMDSRGNPIQLLPDTVAMTPTQAKLAGLLMHRLLPPLSDMDLDGQKDSARHAQTIIDARRVKISVGIIAGPAPEGTAAGAGPPVPYGDPTDKRLRDGGTHGPAKEYQHPNAAMRVAPVTVTLAEMVDRAKTLHHESDETPRGFMRDGNADDIPMGPAKKSRSDLPEDDK